MQDHIFANHTSFGGHTDINSKTVSLQTLHVPDNLKWTTNTYFYLSATGFTHPYDGCAGLYASVA